MLKIWFYDKSIWMNEDSESLVMTEGQEFFVNARLNHLYMPPEITVENWGGVNYPVQITRWDGYSFEFITHEMTSQLISMIQSCSVLWIEDNVTNEILKVSKNSLNVEYQGRLSSEAQGFNVTFKTKKTAIYPGVAKDNINSLVVDSVTYYTDFDILPITLDTEVNTHNQDDGKNIMAKYIGKSGIKALFFMMRSDAMIFKQRIEKALEGGIVISPGSYSNLETAQIALTDLPEGLVKCELTMITSIDSDYA